MTKPKHKKTNIPGAKNTEENSESNSKIEETSANDPNNASKQDTPVKKPVKRSCASLVSQPTEDSPETPACKKTCPTGMGFQRFQRTMECVICSRPRSWDQRGRGCPTCLTCMRKKGFRSLEVVMAQEPLRQEIRSKSLEIKPIKDETCNLKAKLSEMEKLLKDFTRNVSKAQS